MICLFIILIHSAILAINTSLAQFTQSKGSDCVAPDDLPIKGYDSSQEASSLTRIIGTLYIPLPRFWRGYFCLHI